MRAPIPPRRRPWRVATPLIAFLLLAAGWAAFWFFAARKAEATITAWMEREAALGRVYACRERSVGGFPFRIEVRCAEPTADVRSAPTPLSVKAKSLLAVAQVYRPNVVIAEITGPLEITEAGRPGPYVAEWSLAQASLHGAPIIPDRVSVSVDAPRLSTAAAGAPFTIFEAKHLEAHGRLSPGATWQQPVFDLSGTINAGVLPPVRGLSHGTFDGDLALTVRGVRDFSPKPFAQRLREWQAAGGRVEVVSARFQQGSAVALAKGDIGLSAQGRLDGTLAVTLADFERVIASLVSASGAQGVQTGVLAGLALLGTRADVDGKRGYTLPLRFDDGAVSLGPIKFGQTPPLY